MYFFCCTLTPDQPLNAVESYQYRKRLQFLYKGFFNIGWEKCEIWLNVDKMSLKIE